MKHSDTRDNVARELRSHMRDLWLQLSDDNLQRWIDTDDTPAQIAEYYAEHTRAKGYFEEHLERRIDALEAQRDSQNGLIALLAIRDACICKTVIHEGIAEYLHVEYEEALPIRHESQMQVWMLTQDWKP